MTNIIPLETKNKILEEIKLGERSVASIAQSYGIKPNTVYNWIHRGVSQNSDIMELSRLRRKNKELYEIMGRLTEAIEIFKKK